MGARAAVFGLVAALCCAAPAQASPADEARAAAVFDRIAASPARLRVFLQAMPKGGDLHLDMGGSVYAEQFIALAGDKGLCISRKALTFVPPPCEGADLTPAQDVGRRDAALYGDLIEAMSTRAWRQGVGANDRTGRDDFFAAFPHFAPVADALPGYMLSALRRHAATNHVSYLEIAHNPRVMDEAAELLTGKPWNPDDLDGAMVQIAPALPGLLTKAIDETEHMGADYASRLDCSEPPNCSASYRFQAYAQRGLPAPKVFAQLAFAFALVDRYSFYGGVNLLGPEDGPTALADFDLHMRMLRYFHARYPKVRISLHAGELGPGMAPPADLSHHIRDSIGIAGASRIGHGTAVAYETVAAGLLERMAREKIAVEIELTSDDVVLGVRGARHPLALYRAAGVPVVLSTGAAGVLRSDMTSEFLRAATEHGLRYADLKAMARASLEFSFLDGESLWKGGKLGTYVDACAKQIPVAGNACWNYIGSNEKAGVQWKLEDELTLFEWNVVTEKF